MSTVFRRELRAFFHTPSGYLFWSAFALLVCVFVTLIHISYGYASFEMTLSYLSIGFAAVLPVLTMALLFPTKQSDGAPLLRLLPLSWRDIWLGRYLTALSMLLLATAVLGACPLLLNMLGEVRYLTAYLGLLGFFVIGHAILSICLFVASAVSNRLAAWIVSYGVLLALWGIGRLSALLPQPLRAVTEVVSVFGTYTPFVFGVLDWRMILFCLTVSAVFMLLTTRSERNKWTR